MWCERPFQDEIVKTTRAGTVQLQAQNSLESVPILCHPDWLFSQSGQKPQQTLKNKRTSVSSDSESIEITFHSFVFPLVSVNFSSAPHTCWLLGFLVWMGIYTYMFVQYTPLPHSSPARMERGFASSHQNWITQHPNEDDYLTLSYMPLWEVHHRSCFQTWSCWVAIDL